MRLDGDQHDGLGLLLACHFNQKSAHREIQAFANRGLLEGLFVFAKCLLELRVQKIREADKSGEPFEQLGDIG